MSADIIRNLDIRY